MRNKHTALPVGSRWIMVSEFRDNQGLKGVVKYTQQQLKSKENETTNLHKP